MSTKLVVRIEGLTDVQKVLHFEDPHKVMTTNDWKLDMIIRGFLALGANALFILNAI
jgi:hypothetical protein